MAKPSPTSLSIDYLYSIGYTLVVKGEHWNAWAKVRQDFAGILDLIAFRKGETLGIQVTSRDNMASRRKKIADHENTPHIRDANWGIQIHGWDKGPDGKWRVKVEDVS